MRVKFLAQEYNARPGLGGPLDQEYRALIIRPPSIQGKKAKVANVDNVNNTGR